MALRRDAERLNDLDPANSTGQSDLSRVLTKGGDLMVALGDVEGGIREHQRALALSERLAAQEPANVEWQTDLVLSRMRFLPANMRIRASFSCAWASV